MRVHNQFKGSIVLKEFINIRQEKNGYRRLFSDEDIDLYLWYDDSKSKILGFQLVYGKKQDNMRAFTWESDKGICHTRVDDEGWYNPTPILVRDGIFKKTKITKQFKEKCENLDNEIINLVLEKISAYKNR